MGTIISHFHVWGDLAERKLRAHYSLDNNFERPFAKALETEQNSFLSFPGSSAQRWGGLCKKHWHLGLTDANFNPSPPWGRVARGAGSLPPCAQVLGCRQLLSYSSLALSPCLCFYFCFSYLVQNPFTDRELLPGPLKINVGTADSSSG